VYLMITSEFTDENRHSAANGAIKNKDCRDHVDKYRSITTTFLKISFRTVATTPPRGANGAPIMPVRSEEAPPAQPNVPTTPPRGANGAPIMPVRSTDH
jgi:hypothetical protein